MSDLSRLLGDVYGTGVDADLVREKAVAPVEAPVAPVATASPDWADESVLDEAFADWVPGPPTDAPAAERAALSDLASFEVVEAPPATDAPATLAEALPVEAEWFFDAPPVEATAAAVVDLPAAEEEQPAPVLVPWQRTDDDLLPAKGRRRRR